MVKWFMFSFVIVLLMALIITVNTDSDVPPSPSSDTTTITAQSSSSESTTTQNSRVSTTAQSSSVSTTAQSSSVSTTAQSSDGISTTTGGSATSTSTGASSTSSKSSVEGNDASSSSLRILLTSDLEYNIFPVHSENHSLCYDVDSGQEQTTTDCVGGLSRLVSYVDDNVNQFQLLLDTGNIAGQTYFPQLKFNPLTDVVQRLNFTAMAVDPELLKYGADAAERGFLRRVADAAVAANLAVGSVDLQKSKSVSLDVQKSKSNDGDKKCEVAVIGVVSQSKVEALSVPGVNASDEVSAVKEELNNLNHSSEAGMLITIVIGDTDENTTEAIAAIEGVNVVIVSGANISETDTEIGNLSTVVQLGSTYVVTLQRNVNFPFILGNLEITLENLSCNITDVKLDPLDYSNYTQTDDLAVKALEKAGMARLNQMTSPNLGFGSATITSTDCDAEECALGNLVVDAMVNQLMLENRDAPRLAFYPGHSFSNNSLLSQVITGTAVDTLFERDDFLYSVVLSAPNLKSVLEESVVSGNSFLQVSALMRLQFDMDQPEGSRVANVWVVSGDAVTFTNVNLTDNEANITVTVPASMLWNSSILQEADHTFHLLSVSEAVKSHVLRAGVLVLPPAGSRVTYITMSNTTTPTTTPTTTTPTTTTPTTTSGICSDNTVSTIFITLVVTAACVAGATLFWVYAIPRIRLYRARRDSSLPLVVQY